MHSKFAVCRHGPRTGMMPAKFNLSIYKLGGLDRAFMRAIKPPTFLNDLSLIEVIMPRARLKKLPVPIIAASPAMIAELFSVRTDDIAHAIEQGLPSYRVGNRRRILIEDAVKWMRSLPQGRVSHE
jgi:hypothetical protein